MNTRSSTEQLAFRYPAELPLNVLPTELDVAKCFLFKKRKWMNVNQTKKNPQNNIIAEMVATDLNALYTRASIPTIRKDEIIERVLKLYQKRENLQKTSIKRRFMNPDEEASDEQLTEFFLVKQEEFKKSLSCLFEIADNTKVPKVEVDFLEDQRNARKMCIAEAIDKNTTRKIIQKERAVRMKQERVITENKRKENEMLVSRNKLFNAEALGTGDFMDIDISNATYKLHPSTSRSRPNYITIPAKKTCKDLKDIADAAVRNKISDRATVAIVNATLRSYQIPDIVDKSKFRRSVNKRFEELDKNPVKFGGGLCYDGRKDLTLVQQETNGKFYQSKKIEEHISLVSLPDGTFMGHVTPTNGKAQTIANCIINFMKEKGVLHSLEALSSDGTNTNVGAEGGINHLIESEIGRPLHWFICLLHVNELPLRHLITELDGPTSGANTFTGPIGKLLPSVTNLTIASYNRFSRSQPLANIPENILKDLSTDQKYLWKIVTALISGKLDSDLELLTIGPCCHSRWLTTACRICRLYACTKDPTQILITLTTYIVDIYAPMWFSVKYQELATDGPENLYFLINKSERMDNQDAKAIVQRCIQRNAFFAHPENILLSQLSSKLESNRVVAVKIILKSRSSVLQSAPVRRFRVPKINFKAKKWHNMINWNETEVHEPPMTLKKTDEELQVIINNPLEVPRFKCHSQMVERAVKEVTNAAKKVIGEKRRESTIRTAIENRSRFPKQESKKDFVGELNS